jgi:hypothetical protein
MIANWQKIYKNNFFSGNYDHFRTPRTELEAKRNDLTPTWFRAKRAVSDKEVVSDNKLTWLGGFIIEEDIE